ncbi:hypothetical protein [Rhodopirellula europaea]|uniref:hypothetical protein n=1 Tax=Rhodopirellula europaea TaxID=1263866 RepID=UPI0005864E3C|nr:hypothetical protein [Rhodopirellula europaea]
MSDGMVILGTVLIVGVVAVIVVALVYDRPLGINGSKEEITISTKNASVNSIPVPPSLEEELEK